MICLNLIHNDDFRIIYFVFPNDFQYSQLPWNSHVTYYLHTIQTNCHLANPVLCHYHPLTHFFYLSYTTRTTSILQSNLNYEKEPKCVNISSFLHTNLSYEKVKNALIIQRYFFLTKTTKFFIHYSYHFTAVHPLPYTNPRLLFDAIL